MIPKIIHEDDDFLILDKPSGMVVHPFDFSGEETLLDFLAAKVPSIFLVENLKLLQDKRIINTGGLVHKLDRETSGIMVVAKNQNAYDELSLLFKNHTIEKEYLAVVQGIIEKNSFTIDAPLGRNKKEYKQSVNPTDPRGELREAITEVKVLIRDTKNNTTTVALFPKTGRTHQLRTHMAHIGHPIIGDRVYGEVDTTSPRLMLHAKKLSFALHKKKHTFETDTPEEFK